MDDNKTSRLIDLVAKHWQQSSKDSEKTCVSMSRMFGREMDCVYLRIGDRKASWYYDKQTFTITVGTMCLRLPTGEVVTVFGYEDILRIKKDLDKKIDALLAREKGTRRSRVSADQAKTLAEQQRIIESLQRRLELLEAGRGEYMPPWAQEASQCPK